jgi:hypothetical protein
VGTRTQYIRAIARVLLLELPAVMARLGVNILDAFGQVQEDIVGSPTLSLLISIVIVAAGIPLSLELLGWIGKVMGYIAMAIGIVGVVVSARRLHVRNQK